MLSLSRCNNINDLRKLAKCRFPSAMFHYIDGGIRRATHIIKVLALGADAVSIVKVYLYGHATNGKKVWN